MHRAIAAKLRESPSLLAITEENIAPWLTTCGGAPHYLGLGRHYY